MEGVRFESFSRDLLRRFGGNEGPATSAGEGGGEADEVELSLALSLGGSFGDEGKKLVRASSIASFSPVPRREEREEFQAVAASALARTSSLPSETEEERRKRKAMQSLRRMEAKRKRLERRNSMKAAPKAEEDCRDGAAGAGVFNGFSTNRDVVTAWLPRPAKSSVPSGAAEASDCLLPPLQGSGSAGGGAEFDKRAVQGITICNFSSCTESNNLQTRQVCDNNGNKNAAINCGVTSSAGKLLNGENEPSKKLKTGVNRVDDLEKNMMEKMPSVSTKGGGPNGRKIEGFLYKYKKGEELRIVCVCHGNFLTPAEFVKHAGGGDVTHPLRHIIVDPTPSVF